MSKVRQFPKLVSSTNFGTVVKKVVNAGITSASSSDTVHVILDSYKDESIKEGERRRRADDVGSVEQYSVDECTPVPQQIDKFWASSENKSRLLQLTRKVVTARNFPVNIILSGMVVDEELLPSMYFSRWRDFLHPFQNAPCHKAPRQSSTLQRRLIIKPPRHEVPVFFLVPIFFILYLL